MKQEKDIHLPSMRIQRLNKVILDLSLGQHNVKKLREEFGSSRVSNALPTLRVLDLINYDVESGMVELSNDGIKYFHALNGDNIDKAKEQLRTKILITEPWNFVLQLVKSYDELTRERIGLALMDYYSKDWDKPEKTGKRYAITIATYIDWCNLGNYSNNKLKLTDEFKDMINDQDENIINKLDAEKNLSQRTKDIFEYIELGQNMGIVLTSTDVKNVKQAVEEIMKFCKKHGELNDIYNLFKGQLSLFPNTVDSPQTFIPIIEFLKNQLKKQ